MLGLTYGVQLANLMNVANSIAGSEEMVLVFALELFLEGVGSLIGAPLTSKLLVYFCMLPPDCAHIHVCIMVCL